MNTNPARIRLNYHHWEPSYNQVRQITTHLCFVQNNTVFTGSAEVMCAFHRDFDALCVKKYRNFFDWSTSLTILRALSFFNIFFRIKPGRWEIQSLQFTDLSLINDFESHRRGSIV